MIFISHSSEDYETAKKFCDVFEANGLGCWIAPRDIPYGAAWAETIVRGVRASSIMLVLITENSVASKHVIREIHAAVQNDIQVLYVKLDRVPLSDGLSYYLDVLQEIDIDLSSDRCDEELLRLVAYLKTCLSGSHRDGSAGKAKPPRRPTRPEIPETPAFRDSPESAGAPKAGGHMPEEEYPIPGDRPGAASEDAFSDMMKGLLKKLR